jgi:hypothetical protein
MRNILITLTLAAMVPCAAQEVHLSGGYNSTNAHEAGNEHWTGQGGYQFGADLQLGKRCFVRPGALFLVRNLSYTYTSAADLPAQEFHYTTRSLAIPIMLGIHMLNPADDPAVNLYALGGPTALLGLTAELDNDELNASTRGLQWYLGAGAGLTFGFLFIEGGYNVAMSNVFEGDAFATNPKANYVYGSAGVRLKLAK